MVQIPVSGTAATRHWTMGSYMYVPFDTESSRVNTWEATGEAKAQRKIDTKKWLLIMQKFRKIMHRNTCPASDEKVQRNS